MNSIQNEINNIDTDLTGFDLELFLVTEVLGLSSLHYGYWPKSLKVELANAGKAQALYTQKLIRLIPKGVRTIVDIGSGIGDVARALSKKGFRVTAISKDKQHKKYYEKEKQIKFHNIALEDFETDTQYDLMLMSESQSYFPMEYLFERARQLVKKHGYVLISGLFVKNDFAHDFMKGHRYNAFIQTAIDAGFTVRLEKDITKETIPTIRLAEKYITRGKRIFDDLTRGYTNKKNVLKKALLFLLFHKEISIVKRLYHYYHTLLNEQWFGKNVRYMQVLFQRND